MNKKKVPEVFKKVERYYGWQESKMNLDMGGGKYDTATKYLSKRKVANLIYDPHNRTPEHNLDIARHLKHFRADTATISNVLCVVRTKKEMSEILLFTHFYLKKGGKCFITCYKAPKKGMTKKDCFQQGEPLEFYMPLVKKVFGNVEKKYGMLIARKGD